MKITLNGVPVDIPENEPVLELLRRTGVDPLQVAVERNRNVLKKDEFTKVNLQPGDVVEVLRFVGGG